MRRRFGASALRDRIATLKLQRSCLGDVHRCIARTQDAMGAEAWGGIAFCEERKALKCDACEVSISPGAQYIHVRSETHLTNVLMRVHLTEKVPAEFVELVTTLRSMLRGQGIRPNDFPKATANTHLWECETCGVPLTSLGAAEGHINGLHHRSRSTGMCFDLSYSTDLCTLTCAFRS